MRKNIHCPRCGFTTNHKENLYQHFHKKNLCKYKFVKASRRQMIEEYDKYQERYLEHINRTIELEPKIPKNKIKLIPKQKITLKSTMIIYDKIDEINEEIEHPDETECKKLLSSLMIDLIDINVSTLYDYIKTQPIDKTKHSEILNISMLKKLANDQNLKIPDKIPITQQQTNPKKYIKKHISKTLKNKVWDLYIGRETGISKCFCCDHTEINSKHFECGHMIAESNNGKTDITNLRPICSLCNKSMGKKNMFNFMTQNGFVIKNPVMICD
jgi:hypothetical protein